MRKALSLVVACVALSSSVGCGGSRRAEAPPRSPTLDYPGPAQETSQGEVVGADRVPPEDKLRTGARIGPGGITPSEGPPTTEPKHPPVQPKKNK